MTSLDVCARIQTVGILPGIRVASSGDALFGAEAVYHAGIPIAEITMTVPGAIDVIACLRKTHPEMIVGAGTVLDADTARCCLDAGAMFLTSTGLVLEVVEFARKNDVPIFPGALTPTEVITAWKAGADLVKVFPCAAHGGHNYIRSLKTPLPQVALIASGGVNQLTASNYILAGASVLGVGAELIAPEALRMRKEQQIHELTRRFLAMVKDARAQKNGGKA